MMVNAGSGPGAAPWALCPSSILLSPSPAWARGKAPGGSEGISMGYLLHLHLQLLSPAGNHHQNTSGMGQLSEKLWGEEGKGRLRAGLSSWDPTGQWVTGSLRSTQVTLVLKAFGIQIPLVLLQTPWRNPSCRLCLSRPGPVPCTHSSLCPIWSTWTGWATRSSLGLRAHGIFPPQSHANIQVWWVREKGRASSETTSVQSQCFESKRPSSSETNWNVNVRGTSSKEKEQSSWLNPQKPQQNYSPCSMTRCWCFSQLQVLGPK